MVIKCPKCSAEFDVSFDEVAEVKVQCDGCGEKFVLRDALYERGMEFAKQAKELYDADKDNESIECWATAKSYFLPAANAGHLGAQYQMGWIYYVGLSVDKNFETAVEWYKKGAAGGDKEAYYHLALSYEYGEGVEKNMKEAVRLMRLSANSGYTPAHNVLGSYYREGDGVKQDYRMALAWYRLAVEDGNNWSIKWTNTILESCPELKAPLESGAAIIGEAQFKSGIEEYSSDPKFQAQMKDESDGAKRAIALLFWYWTNAVMMNDAEKKLYVAYRDSLERELDETSLNFMLGEYQELNAADDVARIKSLLERNQSAEDRSDAHETAVVPAADSQEGNALDEYVVPDGAPNDRPKSMNMVMDDNPFAMTDGFARRKVTCAACGKPFTVAYRKLVDLTDNDTIASAIQDLSYFMFTCPHCGQSSLLQFRMVVYHVMKRYYIRSFDDFNSLLSVHKQRSTPQGSQLAFPDEFLPLVRHRLVLGAFGLSDKLAVFEAGLDDYAVEGLKNAVIQKENLGDKILYILFDKVENGELCFNLYYNDGRDGACHVPIKFYDEVKASFDGLGTFTEGVFRWVDRQTMVGQYADMATWWAGDGSRGGASSESSQDEEDSDGNAASWSARFANDPQRSEIWVRAAKETEKIIGILSDRGGFGRENGSMLHVQRGEVIHFEISDTDMYETISSKNTSLRHLGNGSLVLTNKRIVFIYSAMIKSINYDDIAVFETDWLPHAGKVRISVEKRVRMVQFNTRCPLLCGMVYQYYTDRGFKARLDGYFKCAATDPRLNDFVGEMLERMSHAVGIEDSQEKERRRMEEERRKAEILSRQRLAEYRRREEEERAHKLIARVCYWGIFIMAFLFFGAGLPLIGIIIFIIGLIVRQAFK